MERAALFTPLYPLEMLSKWLQDALKSAGVSQAALARHLTSALGRSIDRAAVNKMATGDRRIKGDELLEITRFLKVLPPDQDKGLRTVRVAAHVQAGHFSENWEWPEDDMYDVAVPTDPLLARFTLYAAETKGRSMDRRYPEGTVVVFTNIEETQESPEPGRRYIVERKRADGEKEHTVKLLHRDENGRFWLLPESTDPTFQTPIAIDDGIVDGDEVRIIGRVRFAVSRE